MKQTLRLLHTSDIHLDNQIGTGSELSPAQAGFISVVDAALRAEVDIFLLAGDLFDHNRVKSECLDFASEQLARLSCPVVMITGNHDCMADYSIYHKYDPRDAGEHIIFLQEDDGGLHRFDEMGVTIWGRGIVDHHPGHKPMERVPGRQHSGWYLGMTHGHYTGQAAERFSSLITPEEIAASELDYLALGHVHVFSVMEHGGTTAAYSGSPNASQGGRDMTAAMVNLDPDKGVSVEKLELSPGTA